MTGRRYQGGQENAGALPSQPALVKFPGCSQVRNAFSEDQWPGNMQGLRKVIKPPNFAANLFFVKGDRRMELEV